MTDVATPLLPELCDLMRTAGVRVHLGDQSGRCFAHPPARLTPAIMAGLRRYKLELLRALKSRGAPLMLAPEPCARCGSDVVISAGLKCSPCSRITTVIEFVPGTSEEKAELERLESNRRRAAKNTEQLSPTVPRRISTPTGTVGTVGDR